MTEAERIWSETSDDDLLEAAAGLATYTDEGQRVIREELRRRGLEDPVEQARFAAPDPDVDDLDAELPDVDDEPAAPELRCLRCKVELDHLGTKKFHDGTHWGAMGELEHLFEKSDTS